MATTSDYLNKLVEQKNTLADNLVEKGVNATHDETLETLVPKVLDIQSGSGGNGNGIYPIGTDGRPTGDVVVPEGVTSLYQYIFANNTNVESITFSEGFTTASDQCFSGCKNLKSVTFPSTLTTIGNSSFNNCTLFTNLNFNSSTNSITINSSAFNKCTSLIAIDIPDGMTISNIGRYAFQECTSLSDAAAENVIQSSETIGDYIFYGCTGLTNLNIRTVTGMMFRGCTNLTNIIIQEPYNGEIKGNVFYQCTSLESCVLPEGTTRLGVNVFSDCSALKTVYLPSSITTATNNSLITGSHYIFTNCTALEDVQLGVDWNMDLSVSVSENITVDSMVAMFNNLKDLTGDTAKTLTLGEVNLAKLTDEQKAVALNKNWILA